MKNVYDAAVERIKWTFSEFEKVVVSFSGGKDSGVVLNIALNVAKDLNRLSDLTVYHMDYEAQYKETTKYVERVFKSLPKEVGICWVCLPIKAQCATTVSQSYWQPWKYEDKDIWCRDMPDSSGVINEENYPFTFDYNINDYDFNVELGKEFAKKYKTAFLIGIRTQESLNRYAAIHSGLKINIYNDKNFTTVVDNNLVNVYPIYDWNVEDIWIANGKFNWDYNRLYDLYYQAGLSLNQMRVASPFTGYGLDSLKIYKVIEPDTWAKLLGRVNGVNFAGLYGGTTAMGWKSIQLPKGHTWKSYLEFLLKTLPEKTRNSYIEKFKTSIQFWKEKGGVLDDITIKELKDNNDIKFEIGEKSNYNTDKKPVKFEEYPDDLDVTQFKSVPSYKRMCVCIMKNDHLCKYMGFAQTKAELEKRKNTIAKYKNIIKRR